VVYPTDVDRCASGMMLTLSMRSAHGLVIKSDTSEA